MKIRIRPKIAIHNDTIANEILMAIRSGKKYKGDVSLNDPIGIDKEGNELTLLDIMSSDSIPINEVVELRMQVEALRVLIDKKLSPREKLVIELRYGLRNGHCLPQREVAEILEISRSYVSRIEKKALQKLNDAFEDERIESKRCLQKKA